MEISMKHEEYLRKELSKHPFILKSLKRMKDIDHVEKKYLEHFCSIIKMNHFELKRTKLAYNNYYDFFELYDTLIRLTGLEPLYARFQDLNLEDKEIFLADRGIPCTKTDNGFLIIRSESYDQTRLLGAKSWCIQQNENDWYNYNTNRKHLIIASENELYGVSYNKEIFDGFDINNNPVSLSDMKRIVPENYGLNDIKLFRCNHEKPEFSAFIMCFIFMLTSFVREIGFLRTTETSNFLYKDGHFSSSIMILAFVFFILEIIPKLLNFFSMPTFFHYMVNQENEYRARDIFFVGIFDRNKEYLMAGILLLLSPTIIWGDVAALFGFESVYTQLSLMIEK